MLYTIDRNAKEIGVAKTQKKSLEGKKKLLFNAIQEISREYEAVSCLFFLSFFPEKKYSKNLWEKNHVSVDGLHIYVSVHECSYECLFSAGAMANYFDSI